uniref:Uncharacterized protein n=1 Tax=Rhizophora mucronata TaxID=61149 RepID=A0A2P2MY87_RHIMU
MLEVGITLILPYI